MSSLRLRRGRAIAALAAAGVAVAIGLPAALSDGEDGIDATDLSPRQLVGQRLIAGFDGAAPPRRVEEMIRRGDLAGLILFSDNLRDRALAKRMVRRLQSIRRPPGLRDPLLIMVDQEGGLVKRLDGPPDLAAAGLGRRGPAYSREQGRRTARNLRGVGINVDLAPVLDIGRPGGVIRATRRAFGATAERVGETAIPFATGLERGGVAATAKHFPGLGSARLSTDEAIQRLQISLATLRAADERPYRRFIAAGGDLVMLSTAIYPALAPRPAALARPIATEELRDRLGFAGVSISDALGTVAVRAVGGPARVGLAAARAGTDLLLFTDHRAASRAGRALLRALGDGTLGRDRFEQSVQRVLDLRAGLG